MKQHIKQWMKQRLIDRQIHEYDRLLERKTVTYDAWIREKERGWADADMQIRCVPYEACRAYVTGNTLQYDEAQVVLFVRDEKGVSEIAEAVTAHFFSLYEEVDLAYGDEDVMSPEKIRYTPWLKPDWSPDTFLSFFYFGSVFAVRRKALRALTEEEQQWIWKDPQEHGGIYDGIYRLCYVLAVKSGGFEKRKDRFPIGHMDEILFHSGINREMELTGSAGLTAEGCPVQADRRSMKKDGKQIRVSVIIPSKDNKRILQQCILSLQQSVQTGYEVIVVDNGSAEVLRTELEGWLGEQGENYHYIYSPMPFHFSRMCNLGAERAEGEVLLFLNDDVEIPKYRQESAGQEDWLQMIYRMAVRSFTGAVGVKLYYPCGRRIQHAGIVNLKQGPVHKLQFQEDAYSYYYGFNQRNRNVIAVTGACLAVEKRRFDDAGGFPEELPVAFNDVDLCFSLYERGYYNVVLQELCLYHHESLSRGRDDDRRKLERLLSERDKLYQRHPEMWGRDPFYHKYFANEMLSTGFELGADYETKPQNAAGKLRMRKGVLTGARQDACVMISLEFASRLTGCGSRYGLQGYSFVTGSDNACFEKYIMLLPVSEQAVGSASYGEKVWLVKAEPYIRKDVEQNLPDQRHVGMTGFNLEFTEEDLPQGSYRIGVMVRDRCTGQKIYDWTNRYLTAE